ncbi:MAG TPA: acetyl-CoA hydrolase/transferase C-terminal domain-containing protein [Candidatus Limnocylindrales bacterium]|nr:acetyl-CoA hydrolase/transferase C-terminal domain-containing protein [Candidatus Limnocylindrales bacterium]
MDYQSAYRQKLVTPDAAVKVVKSGDWVDYNGFASIPVALDVALAGRKDELSDIKVRTTLSLRMPEVVNADSKREVFTVNSWHFSGLDRKLHDQGLMSYIPMAYRNKPQYYRKSKLPVDVAMFVVTPMDKHGYFNFGLTVSASRAIADQAKVIIVEVNEMMPWARGGAEELIHISEVDYIVEHTQKLPVISMASPSETDKIIARQIVEEIPDGATVQLGIGGMPNTVGNLIAESDLKGIGCHTEMLVDAFLTLFKTGKLTNNNKNIDRGKSAWSFCVGSQELYDWVDHNPSLAGYPVSYTNAPHIMSQNDNLITINNCVEVDLFGQISSESAGTRQISGTGGQLDFLTGGFMSNGGKSLICFTATCADKANGGIKSRVVPVLPSGETVTGPRTQAHYLVTEYGKVNLSGLSIWERAEKVISLAHPDFRDDLVAAAEKLNIWRWSNKLK